VHAVVQPLFVDQVVEVPGHAAIGHGVKYAHFDCCLKRPPHQQLTAQITFPQVVLHIERFFRECRNGETRTECLAWVCQQFNT